MTSNFLIEMFFFLLVRIFYGPLMGGFLTQQLTFEWAATIQGGLSGLAVSRIVQGLCLFLLPQDIHIHMYVNILYSHTYVHMSG